MPEEAANAWLKEHPDVLEGWLEGVTTFEGEPGLPAVKEHLGISSRALPEQGLPGPRVAVHASVARIDSGGRSGVLAGGMTVAAHAAPRPDRADDGLLERPLVLRVVVPLHSGRRLAS